MSEEPSVPEPARFSENDFFSFLLDRGLVGLAWADRELVVKETVGKLAWWLTPGDHITQDLAPFIGLDDEFYELMDDFRPSLVLSNVGLNVEVADSEKASIEVFWQESAKFFVIILHRLGGQPEFEADMARQVRGRRLAEEKVAAMQLQITQKQSLLDIIAERSPVGLAVQDRNQAFSFVTKRWLEQIGTTDGAHTFGNASDFDKGVASAMGGHESAGWPQGDDAEESAGPFFDMAWRHRAWHDSSGNISGVVSAIHPLPEMTATHRKLRGRVADLTRVNADLESFAAMLAHDIRAPIAALRGKLGSGSEASTQGSLARDVDDTLARLEQIANGLLDFATASGQSGPTNAVDLEAMVRRICEDCTVGSNMRYEISGDWPITRLAVAPLDLILRNLVQNAVKHHDLGKGRVSVHARQTQKDLEIEVSDDGPGIDPAHHAEIFEPLTKVRSNDSGTTGLGLAFVKRAATSVSAKLTIESNPGEARGTTFRLKWPL